MILRAIKRIFAPLAIACLVYFAWDARESLLEVVSATSPPRLLAAILVWSLMHLVAPLLSTVVFRARSYPLSYRSAAEIHISNLPARYVPGGVWHTMGRIADFRNIGIRKLDIAIFVFLENALAIGVAFMIGGLITAVYQDRDGWGQVAAFAAAGGLALLAATPFILSIRIGKGDARVAPGGYLAGILVVAVCWCVGAGAFVIYLSAFPALELQSSPVEAGGIYLFSWGVGFVSVFAPQGIGVFEVVAAELIRGTASIKSVAALFAGFRLVVLVADALTWGAQQIWSRTFDARTNATRDSGR